MKYYAIADLHGRYDLLLEAVNKIYSHAETDDYKVITLGDYIDRGPDSEKIISFLMSQGDNFVCLKGNHEAMMVETITTPLMPGWWVGNGGDATLNSYGWAEPYNVFAYEIVPKKHIEWMNNLPIYYETEKQLFVHAGVPQSEMNLPPKRADKYQDMMWMLYDKTDGRGWKGKHVVHGHHQFADGPHVWYSKSGGRTDLDCGAYHTGRLVVGVFDDTQNHALEFIEVFAP